VHRFEDVRPKTERLDRGPMWIGFGSASPREVDESPLVVIEREDRTIATVALGEAVELATSEPMPFAALLAELCHVDVACLWFRLQAPPVSRKRRWHRSIVGASGAKSHGWARRLTPEGPGG
jgi:hypothetical protein